MAVFPDIKPDDPDHQLAVSTNTQPHLFTCLSLLLRPLLSPTLATGHHQRYPYAPVPSVLLWTGSLTSGAVLASGPSYRVILYTPLTSRLFSRAFLFVLQSGPVYATVLQSGPVYGAILQSGPVYVSILQFPPGWYCL